MRLPERYKQTIYVSNETEFDSGEYTEPYELMGIFTPKGDNITYGGGIAIQGNYDSLKFESSLKGARLITQNSKLWIKRKPLSENFMSDHTHTVVGRESTANGWFITINCKSNNVDVPIV